MVPNDSGPTAQHAHGRRPPRTASPDLIVCNGHVRTMTPHHPKAEAVAIRKGRIIAVGSHRDVISLAGRRTEVLDAAGGTVLPGINDSHLHMSAFGLTSLTVDVNAPTIVSLIERVAQAAASAPDGAWVRGSGWDELPLGRPPTRHDLDPVSGTHPVMLRDFTLHALVCNTAALRLAGITRDTIPPAGGVIEKGSDGQPNGVLREGAQNLLLDVMPAYTPAEYEQAITTAITILHSRGITSVTEPGITPELLSLYASMHRGGRLPIRLMAMLHAGDSPDTLRAGLAAVDDLDLSGDKRWFQLRAVKIFTDGVPLPDAQTAWQSIPYADGTRGGLTIAGRTLKEQLANLHEMIKLADAAGYQIGTHAVGDAAIDAVITAYKQVIGRRGLNKRGHYLIHGDQTSPATLRTAAELRISMNFNAQIHWLLDRYLDANFGADRVDYNWPYRTAVKAGVTVATGSDAPVTDPSWLLGLADMITRVGRLGNAAGAAQRITLDQALHTYTTAPAHQDGATYKGTLETGKAGDVIILGADLERVDPLQLPHVPVLYTISGGRIVHEQGASTTTQGTTHTTVQPTRHHLSTPSGCSCYLAHGTNRSL